MSERRTTTTLPISLAAAFAGLLWLAPPTWAQERQDPPKEEPAQKEAPKEESTKQEKSPKPQEGEGNDPNDDDTDLRDLNPFQPPGGEGGAEEMEQLFLTVEKRLQRVTDLLYEASSGDLTGAEGIGGAGIDELIREAESNAAGASSGIARMLEATRGQSEATLTDIERILELAEQQSSSSSSGGGGGGQSNPAPESSDGMPQQGQTPSGSRKEESGERPPQPGQDSPEEQGQDQQGDTPKGNQETEGGPDGPAKAPPGSETGDPSGASGAEEWGDLPIHLRKVFQNGVSDDVPPRYRDWVDSYYRRLNRRSGR